jgi:Na+-driven multidrug efflux pump
MIMKQSFFPIIGSLFHPSYMMINSVVLGSILPDTKCSDSTFKSNNPSKCYDVQVNQAAFGVGSSTLSIILIAPLMCYVLGLSSLIPQAFG